MKQTRCKHMATIGLPLVLLGILICLQAMTLELSAGPATAAQAGDGSVLPFPPVPSASIAKPRLQDSVHKRRAQPQHLKPDAPNVLIILLDDVGCYSRPEVGNHILIGSEDPACDRLEWVDPDSYGKDLTFQWKTQVMRVAQRIQSLEIPNQMKGLVDLYDASDDWIPIYISRHCQGSTWQWELQATNTKMHRWWGSSWPS